MKNYYKDTFAQVVTMDADRILLCLGVWFGLQMFSEDFKNFFLVGSMEGIRDTYVEQPKGFVVKDSANWVLLLLKTLYGIPASPKATQKCLV